MLAGRYCFPLFLIVACSTASAESAYLGLTPGTSSRAEVARVLGAPLRETDTLSQHRSSGSPDTIYAHYGEGSRTVEKIEVIFAEPSDRAEVLKVFALTDSPLLSKTNAEEEFEEYFDAGRFLVLTHVGPDAASTVERIGFLTRAEFESSAKKEPGAARPTPVGSGGVLAVVGTPTTAPTSAPEPTPPLPSAASSPASGQQLTISDLRVEDNGAAYDLIFRYSGAPGTVKPEAPLGVQMDIHCGDSPFIFTVTADKVTPESATAGVVSATLLKEMGHTTKSICEVEVRLKHDGGTLSNPLSRSVTFVSEQPNEE